MEELIKKLESVKSEIDAIEEDIKALDATLDESEDLEEDERKAKDLAEKRDALISERTEIEEEIEERKAEEERAEALDKAKKNQGKLRKIEEKGIVEKMEIRNTKEYIEAFANYIKTNDDSECRALLSTNVSGGQVPVPDFVDEKINTAWEKLEILNGVKKTNLKGNVEVGFELSSTDAVVHTEGSNAPAEEELMLGVVKMVPASIKKWITISDETLDLNGEAFLNYIYEELAYRIFAKFQADAIAKILALPSAATASSVSAGQLSVEQIGLGDFINAKGLLSAEAINPVVITSRQNYAKYKALAIEANYAVDPFDGMAVLYDDNFDEETIAIVGDLNGYQANFPANNDVDVTYDNLSLAEKDLVKLVGRMYVGHAPIQDKAFAVIKVSE